MASSEARPRDGSHGSIRPPPPPSAPAPSPLAPFAAVARSKLGAVAANQSDEALVLRFPIGTTVEEAEKQLILRTLEVIGGNKQKAARILEISRRCLYNKLASYGITSGNSQEEDASDPQDEMSDGESAKN
jgi:DNA-binding NtrC family response regulator